MNDPTRERARQHVLNCVEQLMPLSTFQELVKSIPEHPARFKDTHPIRMVYETVRSRRDLAELRQYMMTRAYDWERLVIAWGFQRLLYGLSRGDEDAGLCTCFGGRADRIINYGPAALCLAGILCLSGQWYGDPDDEPAPDFPPPEKHFGDGAEKQPAW